MKPSERLRLLGTEQQNIAQKALCGELADLLDECKQNISKYLSSIDSFNGQGISKEMIDAHNAARDAIDTTLAKLRGEPTITPNDGSAVVATATDVAAIVTPPIDDQEHVIVPVEPTQKMLVAGSNARFAKDGSMYASYRAMIRAAQEKADE